MTSINIPFLDRIARHAFLIQHRPVSRVRIRILHSAELNSPLHQKDEVVISDPNDPISATYVELQYVEDGGKETPKKAACWGMASPFFPIAGDVFPEILIVAGREWHKHISNISSWLRHGDQQRCTVLIGCGDLPEHELLFIEDRLGSFPSVFENNAYLFSSSPVLKSFVGKHKGERAFLVGNGPSLNKTNFDLVKSSGCTFAMNRISLLYKRVKWRPTYYIYCSDNIRNKNWGDDWKRSVDEAVADPKTHSFLWDAYVDRINLNDVSPTIINNITEFPENSSGFFSPSPQQFISKSATTLNVAYQLAFLMGFSEIVLLGTDLNWQSTSGGDIDPNHFDSSYGAKIPDGPLERIKMRRGHIAAKSVLGNNGIQIFNATAGTLLDVFPLRRLETICTTPVGKTPPEDEPHESIDYIRHQINKVWHREIS